MTTHHLHCLDCELGWAYADSHHEVFDKRCPYCGSRNYEQDFELVVNMPDTPPPSERPPL